MMLWYGDWNSWAWLAMCASMAALWAAAIYGVLTLARSTHTPGPGSATGADLEEISRDRFVRGEITAQEYQERLQVLRGG